MKAKGGFRAIVVSRRIALGLMIFAATAVLAPAAGATLTLDPGFGTGGVSRAVNSVASFNSTWVDFAPRPAGGWIAVGGSAKDPGEEDFELPERWTIAAFNADGTPDQSFGTGGRIHAFNPGRLAGWYGTRATAVAVQPDGRIVVGGAVNVVTKRDEKEYAAEGDPECNCFAVRAAFVVVRFNADGSLDRSYGAGGTRLIRSVAKHWTENGLNADLTDIAIDSRGGAIVLGHTRYLLYGPAAPSDSERALLYRLTTGGRLDRSFGRGGRVLQWWGKDRSFFPTALGIGVDGRLRVAGPAEVTDRVKRKTVSYAAGAAARFSPRGRLDRSYGAGGFRVIHVGRYGQEFNDVAISTSGAVAFAGATLRKPRDEVYPMAFAPAVGLIDAEGAPAAGFRSGGVAVLPATPATGELPAVRTARAVAFSADGGLQVVVSNFERSRYDQLGSNGSTVESQDLMTVLPGRIGLGVVRLIDDAGRLLVFANETDADYRSSTLAFARLIE